MVHSGIKAQFSATDPLYKTEYKGSYFLSLLLGNDGLSAGLLDIKDNVYFSLEEYVFEGLQNYSELVEKVSAIVSGNGNLNRSFEKITIGLINEYSTLIPDAFYQNEEKSSYFDFVHGNREGYVIREDHLLNLRAKNIYAVPELLIKALQRLFPEAGIRHYSTSLLDGLSLKYKQSEGTKVALHVQYSHFEILCFTEGKLHYFNSFPYTTAEDFIYYVLFVFEQLELNSEKVEVEVYGELDSESPVYNILYKYVRKVAFGKRPSVLKYAQILESAPPNYYYNLFQQFLCV